MPSRIGLRPIRRARVLTKTAATAVTLADQQDVALPGQAGTAELIKRLARKLLNLDREIKDIDKTITERFRGHPYARIIESLPGFGPNLGAEFLVATGGELASFVTPGRLASYAGLVPAKGFGPHQREPAPAETLQSPTSTGVLHGRAVKHPRQRALQAVL